MNVKAASTAFSSDVLSTIKEHGMLSGGETVLVGFSGGPDSSCLLHFLHEQRVNFGITIHAMYVDHNLRPLEVPGEVAFCDSFCVERGIGFMVRSVDVKGYAKEHGINKQEAARELRYRALDEAAAAIGADRIALGHNADDQVETFLMRLLRGAGRKGLSGMPARRGKVIRPLIGVRRRQIEDYLRAGSIPFVVDSSNLEPDYMRNRLRQTVLPLLKEFNPNLAQTILNTVAVFQEEERYFDIAVTKTLMKLISRKRPGRIELFLSPLEGMERVILRRVLRRAIGETEGLRGITFRHIEDIILLVKAGRSGDRIYLPRGVRVIREYSLLVMTSDLPGKIGEQTINPPGKVVMRDAGFLLEALFSTPGEVLPEGKNAVVLDAGDMVFPLVVRGRREGDYFYPLGFGKRKKLQDFFVDEKVPRDVRDSVPLVVSGDSVVWVAGYRADERFRITERTEKFIKLIISPLNR